MSRCREEGARPAAAGTSTSRRGLRSTHLHVASSAPRLISSAIARAASSSGRGPGRRRPPGAARRRRTPMATATTKPEAAVAQHTLAPMARRGRSAAAQRTADAATQTRRISTTVGRLRSAPPPEQVGEADDADQRPTDAGGDADRAWPSRPWSSTSPSISLSLASMSSRVHPFGSASWPSDSSLLCGLRLAFRPR